MGTGAIAVYIAIDYHLGSVLHMGPGFFPALLGAILVLFGLIVMGKGIIKGEKIQGHWSLRALILLPLSLVLFGVLMEHAGLIPALVTLILGSASAAKGLKVVEICLLTVVLVGLSLVLFIWGLDLPFPLIKGF